MSSMNVILLTATVKAPNNPIYTLVKLQDAYLLHHQGLLAHLQVAELSIVRVHVPEPYDRANASLMHTGIISQIHRHTEDPKSLDPHLHYQ